MADNVQVIEQQEQVDPQAAFKAELHNQMQMSLGIAPTQNGQDAEPSASEAASTTTPQTETSTQSDPFSLFKEKFGYETPEAAITEIEQLRAFKERPPVQEYKFENEDSEKLFKALQAGKKSEVYAYLEQEQRIDKYLTSDVSKENAAEVVKMGMQLKYKDLTLDEINYKFNKQFALPPKPVQGSDEMADEYQSRLADWDSIIQDKQMELMIEAKLARPELAAAKTKLVLPDIANNVDAEYLEWKKSMEENEQLSKATTEAYKAFTPKQLETKIPFKDEQNKIDFEFQFEPDAKTFSQAQEMVTDMNKFWGYFVDQAGNPDRQKFIKFIYNGLNHDNIVLNAMNQAKNATIKASLPDNSQGGLVRQIAQPQGELSEFDKQMRASLRGHGGY